MEAGFDGFLPKPAQRQKILDMMDALLKGERGKSDMEKQETIVTQHSILENSKRSVRILLAEDNPVNQRLATLMLTKAGYQVETAGDGREVVDRYTQNPDHFDVILMDIQMPERDGLQATQAIREKGFDAVPIIAMTANAMQGDRDMCLAAGMDDYITKPIKREQVFEILQKWAFTRAGRAPRESAEPENF